MTVTPVDLTASEALFAFMSWLTTRDESITLGKDHDGLQAAELVRDFCIVNMLTEPRADFFDKQIRHPVKGPN